MPTAPLAACLSPRCPGRAVHRGFCARHRRTTSERGYGPGWQKISRGIRARNPACARCGATGDLVGDHVVNGDASLVQTLCRSCNTVKRNAERRGVRGHAPIHAYGERDA